MATIVDANGEDPLGWLGASFGALHEAVSASHPKSKGAMQTTVNPRRTTERMLMSIFNHHPGRRESQAQFRFRDGLNFLL